MLKFLSLLAFVLVLSLFIGLFSIISNNWNRIDFKNSSSCLDYGLWLLCPNDNLHFFSFIFNQKNCIQFNQNLADKNILSTFMQDKFILDFEPSFMDLVQVFYLIGTCFLFLSTLITISILIYLAVKFDEQNFCTDSFKKPGKFFATNEHKFYAQSEFKLNSIKIHLRILLIYLFAEFILRFMALLVYTISSEQYLESVVQKSYIRDSTDKLIGKKLENFSNHKCWSYWLCTLSIVLSFTCQVLVLVNQTLNCGSLESGSKRTRLNSSMKSNKMFLNEKTASQVTTRSNLLSIGPIEVNDDLLAKCDYNICKIPKLDSKLFFIDNEYFKCFDSDGANKCLSDEMLFDSGKNLEKSILLDSDNQLNYIHKLENMLNELYSSSAKNTLRSENHDFDMIKKSQLRSSEKMFNTLSLPNLNEITNYLIENKSKKSNH